MRVYVSKGVRDGGKVCVRQRRGGGMTVRCVYDVCVEGREIWRRGVCEMKERRVRCVCCVCVMCRLEEEMEARGA